MIHVPRTPEFSNCGNINSIAAHLSSDQDLNSLVGGRGRQRSHSYHSAEDSKNYGVQTETVKTCLRPRSRYVLTFYLNTFFSNSNYINDQEETTGMFTHIYVVLCFNDEAKLHNRQTTTNKKTKKYFEKEA